MMWHSESKYIGFWGMWRDELVLLHCVPTAVFSTPDAEHSPGSPTWGATCTARWHRQVFSPGSHRSPGLWEFCATARGKTGYGGQPLSDWRPSRCISNSTPRRNKTSTSLLKILQLNKTKQNKTQPPTPSNFLLCPYNSAFNLFCCWYALIIWKNAHIFSFHALCSKMCSTSLLYLWF